MADPLSSIPALVPTPATSASSRPRSQERHTDNNGDEDRFASLFSPPTPARTPEADIFSLPTSSVPGSSARPRAHARMSSEMDFGSFVSVPAAQDPLGTSADLVATNLGGVAAASMHDATFEFFESFGETAKQASAYKRSSVLDELLAHEDDPLYFLNASTAGTSASKPAPSENGAVEGAHLVAASSTVLAEDLLPADAPSLLDRSLDLIFGSEAPQPSSAAEEPSLLDRGTDRMFGEPAFSPSEEPAADMLAEALSTDAPLPPSKSTSVPVPVMPSRSSTFASRWMPSLRGPRRGSSSSMDASGSPSAPASLAGTLSRTMTSALAVAGPSGADNPFGPHVFHPPSGAPGFAGEHPHPHTARAGGGASPAPFDFGADDAEERRAVLLEGRKPLTEIVLTPELAAQIRSHLPALPRLARKWDLLYSLDQHGISLRTLYARCSEPSRKIGPRPALLIVRDATGGFFGVFVGEGIYSNPGAYHGGGESFLWRAEGNIVRVFRWSGRNDYVALCDPDSISFGGGEGHYGLYLDDMLQDGTSAPCSTFSNEPLCVGVPLNAKTKAVPFECVGLEVWAIGS